MDMQQFMVEIVADQHVPALPTADEWLAGHRRAWLTEAWAGQPGMPTAEHADHLAALRAGSRVQVPADVRLVRWLTVGGTRVRSSGVAWIVREALREREPVLVLAEDLADRARWRQGRAALGQAVNRMSHSLRGYKASPSWLSAVHKGAAFGELAGCRGRRSRQVRGNRWGADYAVRFRHLARVTARNLGAAHAGYGLGPMAPEVAHLGNVLGRAVTAGPSQVARGRGWPLSVAARAWQVSREALPSTPGGAAATVALEACLTQRERMALMGWPSDAELVLGGGA